MEVGSDGGKNSKNNNGSSSDNCTVYVFAMLASGKRVGGNAGESMRRSQVECGGMNNYACA